MQAKFDSDLLETKLATLEVKIADESDEYLTIMGYGSVFGNVDGGGDVVMPGAFKECIASGRKPKMLWQHDPSQPIGAWDEMVEDENGLRMKGRVYKGSGKGEEIAGLIKMGAIEGLSIGYMTQEYEMDADEGVRKLTKLDLWETSVVTFPMNSMAGIYSAKSADEMTDAEIKRHVEKALKAIKISGSMAKAMAAGAMEGRAGVLRDAGAARPEDDQREVDELKKLLTQMLGKKEARSV